MHEWKRHLASFPPPCCNCWWISGPPEQYKQSLLLPHKQKLFFLLFSHPVYVPHPFSKWSARPLSHSLYPVYESRLRTPVQHSFCLELANSSNNIPHSKFLPYYSISLWFKIVIHRAEFSTLLTQISLLKMWHFGRTSELLAQNTLKKKKKIPVSLINNFSYVIRVEHWRINMLMLPWLFYNCSFRWN